MGVAVDVVVAWWWCVVVALCNGCGVGVNTLVFFGFGGVNAIL